MSRNNRDLRSAEAGLTIVELMISLLTSTLVVMGAFAILGVQRPIFRQQAQLQASQRELWVSMEFLQRDIHSAGYGFGFCQKPNAVTPGDATKNNRAIPDFWPRVSGLAVPRELPAIEVNDNTGGAGWDEIVVRYAQPPAEGAPDAHLTVPIDNEKPTTAIPIDDVRNFLPTGCLCNTGTCGSPSLVTPFFLGMIYNVGGAAAPHCTVIQVTTIDVGVCPAANLQHAAQADAAMNPFLSTEGPDYIPGLGAADYAANDRVSNLGQIYEVRYQLDKTVDPPQLKRVFGALGATGVADVIADGIEDMQVAASGCDINGDGTLNEGTTSTAKLTDEWFFNVPGTETVTPTSTACKSFSQLRVTFSARTATTQEGYNLESLPALENHAAGSADGYRHRLMSATIVAPNLGI